MDNLDNLTFMMPYDGSTPYDIVLLNTVYKKGVYHVFSSQGLSRLVDMNQVSLFSKTMTPSVCLAYCCASLIAFFRGDICDDVRKTLSVPVKDLATIMPKMARIILSAQEKSPELLHRTLAFLYSPCLELSHDVLDTLEKTMEPRHIIPENKTAQTTDAKDKVHAPSPVPSHSSPDISDFLSAVVSFNPAPDKKEGFLISDNSSPLRDTPESKKKNRGHLIPGYLLEQESRDFYSALFRVEDGTFVCTRRYEETGFHNFTLEMTWGIENTDLLMEGEYGLLTIYDDGLAYIDFPGTRVDVPPVLYRGMKRMFTIDDKEPEIMLIHDTKKFCTYADRE